MWSGSSKSSCFCAQDQHNQACGWMLRMDLYTVVEEPHTTAQGEWPWLWLKGRGGGNCTWVEPSSKLLWHFWLEGHLSSSTGYMKGKIGGLKSFLILETIGYNLWGDYWVRIDSVYRFTQFVRICFWMWMFIQKKSSYKEVCVFIHNNCSWEKYLHLVPMRQALGSKMLIP